MSRHIWKKEEAQYLENNYYTKPVKDIAKELGLKYQQVVTKAHNLGMNKKKQTGELWSDKEDAILKENFEYASKSYLERRLPKRSWQAIYQRGSLTLLLKRKTQDKYFINHNSFSKWNEYTAYIIGLLLADGYIKYQSGERKENSIQIELAHYDIDILKKIKEYTEFEGPIRKTKRGTVVLNISNTKIIEDILSVGFPLTNKTESATWVNGLPFKYVHHFIRGLFDGDGSVYEKNKSMCIHFLGTEKLIKEIIKVAPAKKKTYHFRGKNGGANVYCLYYSSKEDAKNIYDWMYKDSNIYLDRKYNKFQEFL